jgi:DNA-binding NarL/FixJ family response regulator
VLAGGQYLPPQLMELAGPRASTPAAAPSMSREESPTTGIAAVKRGPPRAFSLSERQREVFTLLAEGLSNKAIARRLGITEGSVKTHVATIFDVLNVHNRVSAVAAARALVDEDGHAGGT